jgi:hypothetical protein
MEAHNKTQMSRWQLHFDFPLSPWRVYWVLLRRGTTCLTDFGGPIELRDNPACILGVHQGHAYIFLAHSAVGLLAR